MTKPIKGKTEECLKHFSETRQEQLNKDRCGVRNRICALISIGESAGYRWFSKQILPSGVNLLKLQYFLELVGYSVIERDALPKLQRELANQLALLVMSTKDAAEYMGVTDDTILRWCTGRVAQLDQRESFLADLLGLRAKEHEERKQLWLETIHELHLASVQASMPMIQTTSVPKHETNGSVHGQMIETLAHLILAAKPLAEQILSDAYTPEEREQLRQKTQVVRSNGVFDLSNLLNRLCSERARKELNH